MTTTTDTEPVTLPGSSVARLRQLLADERELTERIERALADGLVIDELRQDRSLIAGRVLGILDHHLTTPDRPV